MNAKERKETILTLLQASSQPVSASSLAKQLGVSRQIIVGDVALLRASGTDIFATPRGYLLKQEEKSPGLIRTIACKHSDRELEEELNLIVDNGGGVLDVIVEHPLYGELVGQLQLFSRYDVQAFVTQSKERDARPLSDLTQGIHLHTIACKDDAAFVRITQALERAGLLLTKA